jgi:hypothetical protein
VHTVRNLGVAVTLALGMGLFGASITTPAAAGDKNYSSSSNYTRVSAKTAQSDVPPNCVRQECGKLWCWQMRGQSH